MTSIEWTQETWNPTTGCDKISAGCHNCLTPETRVLRADMTWVPIADIQIGDKLVSFTDQPSVGQNRIWEEATVLAKWETEKPTVDFTLANGTTITASEDHRWLIAQRCKDTWWRQTINLTFKTSVRTIRCEPTNTESSGYRAGYIAGATAGDGTFRWPASTQGEQVYWRIAKPVRDRVVLDRIVDFLASFDIDVEVKSFDPGRSVLAADNPLPMAKVETRRAANLGAIADMSQERDTREWMAGYLAGMFDTDGGYSGGNLRYFQSKPNDVLDCVVRYGKELGFDLHREDWKRSCPSVRLQGGIPENIAFLGAISPAMPHRMRDFYGHRVETVDLKVTGIRRGPVRKLIDITTSTGTFIAEGALTHNCYALTMAKRLKAMGSAKYQTDGNPTTSGPGFGVATHTGELDVPFRWHKPRKVFVNSMSDLFHHEVPEQFIGSVWDVMGRTPQHTYQILTKRPARARTILNRWADAGWMWRRHDQRWCGPINGPLSNAWLGCSIEDNTVVDRAHHLRETPAAVRFISAEPLLGPLPDLDLTGIDWLILGGESGPGARPMEVQWARDIVTQCRHHGVAPFVKQLGAQWAKDTTDNGEPLFRTDKKGGNPAYWPVDLRVREYPTTPATVGGAA